jgi:hypothetical protein
LSGSVDFTQIGPDPDIALHNLYTINPLEITGIESQHGELINFQVVVTDDVEERGPNPFQREAQIDNTAPSITLDSPNGLITDQFLDFTITDADSGVMEFPPASFLGENSYRIDFHSNGFVEGENLLVLSVKDAAENITTYERTVNRDSTAPMLSSTSFSGIFGSDQGVSLAGDGSQVNLEALVLETGTGLSEIRYWYLDTSDPEPLFDTPGYSQVVRVLDDSPLEQALSLSIPYITPGEFRVYAIGVDYAGNKSPMMEIGDLRISSGIPEVTAMLTGAKSHDGQWYTANANDLGVTLNPPLSQDYLLSYSTDETTWVPGMTEALTPMNEGEVESLFLRITDPAGLSKTLPLGEILLDQTGPTVDLDGLTLGASFPGGFTDLTFSATDSLSGAAKFIYEIRSTGNVVQSGALGQGQRIFFNSELSLGNHDLRLRGVDTLGNVGPWSSSLPFNLSNQDVLVFTQPQWAKPGDQIAISWQYGGSFIPAQYRLTILRDGIAAAPIVQSEKFLHLSLDEADVRNLEIQVEVLDDQGGLIASGTSSTIQMDATAPVIDSFVLNQNRDFVPAGALGATWEVVEDLSGLAQVGLLLERATFDAQGSFTAWELLAKDNYGDLAVGSGEIDVPILPDGTLLRISGFVQNQAGTIENKRIRTLIYDNSAPFEPRLFSGISAIHPATQALTLSWGHQGGDIVSGISNQEYKIGIKSAGDLDPVWEEPVTLSDSSERNLELDLSARTILHGDELTIQLSWTNGSGLLTSSALTLTIDETAPVITKIALDGYTPGLELSDPLDLKVYTEDTESSVKQVKGTLGEIVLGVFTPLSDPQVVSLPFIETDGDGNFVMLSGDYSPIPDRSLVFRGESYNEAGLSTIGYSPAYSWESEAPNLAYVVGQMVPTSESDGYLQFDWSLMTDSVSAKEYTFALYEIISLSGAEIEEVIVSGADIRDNGPHSAQVFGLASQKLYRLKVIPRGLTQIGSPVYSNPVGVDYSSPELLITPEDFIFDHFLASLSAVDAESGVETVEWSIGTAYDPEYFLDYQINSTGNLNYNIQLLINDPQVKNAVIDGQEIFITAKSQNGAGLWGPLVYSQPMVVDLSPALLSVDRDDLWERHNDGLLDLMVQSTDEQSKISGYQWALSVTDSFDFDNAGLETRYLSPEDNGVLDLDGSVKLIGSLIHGQQYYAHVRVLNGAGQWTQASSFGPITADQEAPVLVLSDAPYAGMDAQNFHIENSDQLRTSFNLSEDAVVVLSTETLAGPLSSDMGLIGSGDAITLSLDEVLEPGQYTLTVQATDQAGNGSSESILIRINQAPLLLWQAGFDDGSQQVVETTPGRPLNWDEIFYLSDTQEDLPLTANVDFGNENTALLEDFSILDDLAVPPQGSITYSHSAGETSFSEYTMQVEASDQFGKTKVYTAVIRVHNTKEGPLYEDEYWSGVHQITGVVTVQDDLTLTVAPETVIIATGQLVNGLRQAGIVINDTGTMIVEDDPGSLTTEFRIHEDLSTEYWLGLVTRGGSMTLEDVLIERAHRAVTLDSGLLSLSEVTLDDGLIGLHYVLGDISLGATQITNNAHYGLKMESIIADILAITFANNGWDIYDNENTVHRGEN